MSDIQDRIAAARREAENLKARIKSKKEELADADCEQPIIKLLRSGPAPRVFLLSSGNS
jgi:guanine nucleotide-binding protein G(I)/G(S)/G(T) subunit beta-1